MLVHFSAVVVDPDPSNRQEMASFLATHGVAVGAQVVTIEQMAEALSQHEPPRLAVVNIDPNPHEQLQRLAPWIRQYPNTSFFVVSQVVEASLLMEAMHIGVHEFVPMPINQAKLVAAIDRIAQAQGPAKRAKVIQFIPTVGGCGSTTIACNVAASLARSSKTLALDLDLLRGAVANAFDIRPRYSIADVTDASSELDKALVDNALTLHRTTGLAVLARPEMPEDSQRVSTQGLTRLLGVVGRMFDYVVVDSIMSLDPLYAAALHAADETVLVMQLNVPSAKNTERFLNAMRRMGIDQGKIKVVVNRFVRKGADIEPSEVERALGLKISWMIPNDFKNAIAAINFGEPVVLRSPRAELSESIGGLMQMLNGRSR